MSGKHRDWAGWAIDLGIACFFAALIVACFSRTLALSLLISFMLLTGIPMFRKPRRK
jgi:hypothetical protein